METAMGRGEGNRWSALKRRLGFKTGLGCCGSSWGFRASSPAHWMAEEDEMDRQEGQSGGAPEATVAVDGGEIRAASPAAMNLATALAAERQFRSASGRPEHQREGAVGESGGGGRWEWGDGGATPMRVSLMRLLAEGGCGGLGEDEAATATGEEAAAAAAAWWCCVCMGRRRGAAFIPCGHTFCRVCSRELWLNRGACPLCNRPILDILDIF